MKKLVPVLFLLVYQASKAQDNPANTKTFINAISKWVVDSNAANYYLFMEAPACSFKKFDYDEWYKYGLLQDIPLYVLNELAEKSFLDTVPVQWQQHKPINAICIDQQRAATILTTGLNQHVRSKHPGSKVNNLVYYFSRPAITDDCHYAVIDMGFRCDNRQCGMGATFIFRQVNGQWLIAGKKVLWGN